MGGVPSIRGGGGAPLSAAGGGGGSAVAMRRRHRAARAGPGALGGAGGRRTCWRPGPGGEPQTCRCSEEGAPPLQPSILPFSHRAVTCRSLRGAGGLRRAGPGLPPCPASSAGPGGAQPGWAAAGGRGGSCVCVCVSHPSPTLRAGPRWEKRRGWGQRGGSRPVRWKPRVM